MNSIWPVSPCWMKRMKGWSALNSIGPGEESAHDSPLTTAVAVAASVHSAVTSTKDWLITSDPSYVSTDIPKSLIYFPPIYL